MSTQSNHIDINKQIIDTIQSMNGLLKETDKESLQTIGNQVLVEAISLAMLNMVNQQQQLYILQNTATTVAVKAMLETNPEEAMKLMNHTVQNNNIMAYFNDFERLLKTITATKETVAKAAKK